MTKQEGIKETWQINFNGVTTIYWDEIPYGERIIPQAGIFHSSKILKTFPDGTTTEIKWSGECKVKAGDKVVLDSDARVKRSRK